MFCQFCGKQVPAGSAACPHCGKPQPAAPAAAAPAFPYAGFWLRFVAYLIDTIVYWFVAACALIVLLMIGGRNLDMDLERGTPLNLLIGMAFIVGWYGYFALMEGSEWQASFGKKAIGLRVTDLDGNRVTFERAAGRAFSKIVSDITFIFFAFGYLMAGFTQRKQALHDRIADCMVLRRT